MTWQYSPYAVVLIVSTCVAAWVAAVAWSRRDTSAGRPIFWFMLAIVQWAGASTLEALSVQTPAKVLWSQVEYVGVVSAPVLFLVFAAIYSHEDRWLSPRNLALLAIIPILTLVIAATNAWHGWLWSAFTPIMVGKSYVIVYGHGFWYGVSLVYSLLLTLVGSLLIVRTVYRSARIYQNQALPLLVGVAIVWAVSITYALGQNPFPGLEIGPVSLALVGLGAAWSILRYRLLDLRPVARDALIDNLGDGVLVVDAQRYLTDLNVAAQRLVGATATSVGQRVEEVLAAWPALLALLDSTEETHAEITQGEDRPPALDVHLTRLRDRNGRLVGRLLLLHDITEHKHQEEERRKLDERLQYTQRLESLGVLAGGVAHDFNNLLTIIMGNAELAVADLPQDAPSYAPLQGIIRASQRAAELSRQMLSYAGRGQFVVQPASLNEIVEDMSALSQAAISQKVSLKYELAPGLPEVRVDIAQMRQMVLSLVTNAAEAIGEQTGQITIRTRVVEADRALLAQAYLADHLPEGRYVVVEVEDTGCGMDQETLKRIFEPFYTTKFLGRGLGLSAVLGIVRGHGGAIQVQSEPGRGSTVKVILPCETRNVGGLPGLVKEVQSVVE